MRNPHAGRPIDPAVTDAEIAAALEDTSVPTLLMACVHLFEDEAQRRAILDGPIRPAGLFLNEYQGFMSPEDQAAGRALALEVIRSWRDRGCPEPEPLPESTLHEMMAWLACDAVGDEYVPMVLEELALDGRDSRAPEPVPGAQAYPVVVVGCGMSGLLAAIRLQQAGFPFVVVEKNDGPGGTWWENSYPGARVDVGSHFYSYSFEPGDHWSEFFSQQPELRAYFERVAAERGIGEHVRFGTEATGAAYDEAQRTWTVTLDDGDTLAARAVVCAVGQLNRPFVPEVPGEFHGPAFHTARWRHDADLDGKDVVMVGAGATGFQVAPAIADRVRSLTVLQRTAQWMFPNPGYHDAVGPGVGWAIRHLPFYGRWFRFLTLWPGCDAGLAAAKVDPAWAPQHRSVSEVNEMVRVMFTDWITSQVTGHGDGDPDLVAKVVPPYPPTAKRTLQDNGSWLRTLTRDHVELVRAGVSRLEPDAVVDSDGVRHGADVLVWATGFRANEFLVPMTVRGRGGLDLREHWGARPRAHLGVTVPGFPNFFMLYGPATNLASGGSIILASECEVAYVMSCLRMLAEAGADTIEPTQAAYDDYYARTQDEVRTMVWSSPHIGHGYYQDDAGQVHGLNPWRLVDYWAWTRDPDPADFEVH